MKQRIAGWIELGLGAALVAAASYPFTRFCGGRRFGLDCESQAIFGINLVGPLGVALIVAGIWMSRTGSYKSQYVVGLGVLGVTLNWVVATL